jgi:amidohydrolase
MDLAALTAFRHALHRRPEVSGAEAATAAAFAAALPPGLSVTRGLGGHGVAAVLTGAAPGPTVMLRAELDALPIAETGAVPWASETPGKAHLCGHDGHLTILLAAAQALAARPPARGRVVFLAQPAEEDGSGAAAVLADPRFASLRPDWAFALHNLPGAPLGQVWLRPGPMNCASLGLKITLRGRTSHAAEPAAARSPAKAMARLIPGLIALGQDGPLTDSFRLVTVTHARLGEPAFGITPGEAEIWATLRSLTDAAMASLLHEAETLARQHWPDLTLSHHDAFAACTNHPEATARIAAACAAEGLAPAPGDLPMRASEDFGRLSAVTRAAMFGLGAGETHPRLHAPDYDFPDTLIPVGARLFERLARDLLG